MGRRPLVKTLVLALWLCACALLATFQLSRSVALADDSSLGAEGGTVHAIWTTDVRLDAETVQATCFGNFAEYRVDFRFVNEGKAAQGDARIPVQRRSTDPERRAPSGRWDSRPGRTVGRWP